MALGTEQITIYRYKEEQYREISDTVAVEEPLEISLVYFLEGKKTKKNISITMRTPGQDQELACGFLFTEGILSDFKQIEKISQLAPNEISIHIKEHTNLDLSKIERHFYTSSSCGVCGKSSIDAIRTIKTENKSKSTFQIPIALLLALDNTVRSQQAVFESTGGLHASALFTQTGEFISLFEDVGRHNALDKLIGSSFIEKGIPLNKHILFLSGRASFELIQKAAMAEIQIICALGAPSSLALSLAKEFNITLVGFLKSKSFNVYHDDNRIVVNYE